MKQRLDEFAHDQRENQRKSQDEHRRSQYQSQASFPESHHSQDQKCRHDKTQIQNVDRVKGLNFSTDLHQREKCTDPEGVEDHRLKQRTCDCHISHELGRAHVWQHFSANVCHCIGERPKGKGEDSHVDQVEQSVAPLDDINSIPIKQVAKYAKDHNLLFRIFLVGQTNEHEQ